MKKTLVIGATANPARYGYLAVQSLMDQKIEVVPMGIKKGNVLGLKIINDRPELEDIHTITLYINPLIQESYYDYILGLAPKRIIFNPGTENPILINKAKTQDIQTIIACTLVMLSIGDY